MPKTAFTPLYPCPVGSFPFSSTGKFLELSLALSLLFVNSVSKLSSNVFTTVNDVTEEFSFALYILKHSLKISDLVAVSGLLLSLNCLESSGVAISNSNVSSFLTSQLPKCCSRVFMTLFNSLTTICIKLLCACCTSMTVSKVCAICEIECSVLLIGFKGLFTSFGGKEVLLL